MRRCRPRPKAAGESGPVGGGKAFWRVLSTWAATQFVLDGLENQIPPAHLTSELNDSSDARVLDATHLRLPDKVPSCPIDARPPAKPPDPRSFLSKQSPQYGLWGHGVALQKIDVCGTEAAYGASAAPQRRQPVAICGDRARDRPRVCALPPARARPRPTNPHAAERRGCPGNLQAHGRPRAEILGGKHRPKSARTADARPKLGDFNRACPKFALFCRFRAKFVGNLCLTSVGLGPTSVRLGERKPTSGPIRLQIGPQMVRFGRVRTKLGPVWSKLSQIWPGFDRLQPRYMLGPRWGPTLGSIPMSSTRAHESEG